MLKQFRSVIGGEARVLLLVAAGLLLGEVAMRGFEVHLSKDVAHLKSFAKLASQLNETTSQLKILFLGNSMTRFGMEQPVFEEEFQERTRQSPTTVKITPDNTCLSDWFYLYKKYFHSAGIKPDVLVIGFEGNHLQDQPPNHPGRLAHYYCQPNDWNDLCRYDLPTLEDRAVFVLSAISSVFGNRDRPQAKAMDMLIPCYREGLQVLYDRINVQTHHELARPAYDRLRSFVEMVKSDHVQLVFVAMPIAADYKLDPALLEILQANDVKLVDGRHIPGVMPEMFPDGIHMTEEASQLYSRYLADAMTDPQMAHLPIHQSTVSHTTKEHEKSISR